jgi:hypothetical protein
MNKLFFLTIIVLLPFINTGPLFAQLENKEL